MKAKCFVYALALLTSVALAREPVPCDNHFGENIQIVTGQIGLESGKTLAEMGLEKGDFNGDGLKDKVIVLRLDKTTRLDNGVTLLNPPAALVTDGKPDAHAANAAHPALPGSDATALGIIQSDTSDKKCRKFVIYNTSYFPVKPEQLYVSTFFASHEDYARLQKVVSGDLRHDAIYLGTPVTAVGLIYWSKGRYVFDLLFDTWNEYEEDD
jgi:hypothetical protein